MESKILLFDFDGTIACTEPFHKKARDMVLKTFGITVNNWTPYLGSTDMSIFEGFKNICNLTMEVQATVDLKLFIFKQLAIQNNLRPFSQMEQLIKSLPFDKFIVSRQREDIVRFFLKRWDLDKYFINVYSLANSTDSKADFIKTLGFPLEKCLFFDDIQDIVDETKNAGIYSILVINGIISDIDKNYLYNGIKL